MRRATLLFVLAAAARAQERTLDEFFAGEIRDVRGNRVTVHYDFEDARQLRDFERVRPKGLLTSPGRPARIEGGRLILEGDEAVLSRMVAGSIKARCVVRVQRKRDLGLLVQDPTGFLLIDLFDHRFKNHGGLLVGAFRPSETLTWHTLAVAAPGATGRFFSADRPVEVELRSGSLGHALRVESFHRTATAPTQGQRPVRRRFGLWAGQGALAIDELTLTVELEAGYCAEQGLRLELSTDAAYRETRLVQLVRQAREKPLSRQAARARRALSLRGPKGWKKLFALARVLARKQAYAAVPVVAALAAGREQQRRDLLLSLSHGRDPPDLRMAVLRGLAPWYPEHAGLLHEGLDLDVPGRRELLRALCARGLPDAVLKRHLDDPELAAEVYAILRDRGRQLSAAELGDLPRLRAREALSPAAARALLEEFSADPNWGLVAGLIRLLEDKDPAVARGAHLLLLTLSGKDLPPDPVFWRSWLSARRGSYQAPPLSAPGLATAAILRGIGFLRRDLLEDGAAVWPVSPDWPGTRVGATALAVYALRAAGVPRDDEAIHKALETTLLVREGGTYALRRDLDDYTYALSLLALALHSIDAKAFRPQLTAIAKRLSEGQLDNGQWTYRCRDQTHARRPSAGDNSNTQYAILALRAARLAGVPVDPQVWKRNRAFWLHAINAWGGWGYGPKGTTQHELSMTSAGIATYSICMEALHGVDAFARVRESKRVRLGLRRLGERLLVKGYAGQELYAYYGVERACILTRTRAFNEFDWYHEGASILVRSQRESGAWGDPEARGIATGKGYGEAIDTAYALLFLKRATTGLPGAGGGGVVKVGVVRPGTVK